VIGFGHPMVLLLAIPAAAGLWRTAEGKSQGTLALRLGAAFLLLAAAAGPRLTQSAGGQDVMVVVDRSASMPESSKPHAIELIGLLESSMGKGDRLGVISFGAAPESEAELGPGAGLDDFHSEVDPNGSDIGTALDLAMQRLPSSRPGKILLVTDGSNTGRPLGPMARRAQNRGIELHVRRMQKSGLGDLSVERLEVPQVSSAGEPLLVTGWIRSDREQRATVRLRRDGGIVAEEVRTLHAGENGVIFQDIPSGGGIAEYEMEVASASDPRAENNTAVAGSLVSGPRSILLVTQDGRAGPIGSILSEYRLEVQSPATADLGQAGLSRHSLAILQDVPATSFSQAQLQSLADYVRIQGGGLLMTGGPSSYGVGGYMETPLEEALPVSMRIRDSRKKSGMALAVALDRSGSMGATAGPNLTKMNLANQGTAAAIELLSPLDSAAVFAVDTEAHTVFPLQEAADPEGLAQSILGIESDGGGIYVRSAIEACLGELKGAKQKIRHILLFADADDAEEQEGVPELLEQMATDGITLSVVALGGPGGSDATFLARTAQQGGGDIYFAQNATELPRLFAMDTMIVSNRGFVTDATAVETILGLAGLGGPVGGRFPDIGGYNVSLPKPGAQLGLLAAVEDRDPVLAYHQYGIGKAGAFTAQVGGEHGQALLRWSGFPDYLSTLARGLAAQPASRLPYASVKVEAQIATYTVEAPDGIGAATLQTPSGRQLPLDFSEGTGDIYKASISLDEPGLSLAVLETGSGSVLLPPAPLSYPQEYSPRISPDRDLLDLGLAAERTGGKLDGQLSSLWEGGTGGSGKPLEAQLAGIALLLVLLEIAERRLRLLPSGLRWPRWKTGEGPSAPAGPSPEAPRETGREETTENGRSRTSATASAMAKARERSKKRLGG
jgi:uncharacterized membrane protein